jgi:bacterioferritin-associated ferredoxin
MANASAHYKNPEGHVVELKLDIDLKSQVIRDVTSSGPQELKDFEAELIGKTIDEVLLLKREFTKGLASMPVWLLHSAIENYLGNEAGLAAANDRLCLCFGITERDLKKEILKRPDYELKNVIAETFATSACGSCLPAIKKSMENIRLSSGLIAGMDHSKSRFDKEGHWVQFKGLYPGPLLIWLDDLKQKWMEREALIAQFEIEFKSIEGLHLDVNVINSKDKTNVENDRALKILEAFSEYLKSETGILFFLHPAGLL